MRNINTAIIFADEIASFMISLTNQYAVYGDTGFIAANSNMLARLRCIFLYSYFLYLFDYMIGLLQIDWI